MGSLPGRAELIGYDGHGLAKLYPLPVIADVEASDDVLYQASLT
jgi:hypothetical protein